MQSAIPHTSLQDTLRDLHTERTACLTRACDIDDALAALTKLHGANGNGANGHAEGRFVRSTVGDACEAILRTKATKHQTTSELAEAILAGGYETDSDNFTQVVYVTLSNSPHRFERVARGVWALRDS